MGTVDVMPDRFEFMEMVWAGEFPRGVLGRVGGRLVFYRDVTAGVRLFGCWALEQAVVDYLVSLGEPVEVHYYDLQERVLYMTTPAEMMAQPRFLQERNGRRQYVVPPRCWRVGPLTYTAPVPGHARTLHPRRRIAV